MNVNLTPKFEQLIHSKVKTGRYSSASQVVREALRIMEEHDQMKMLRRDDIRRKIDQGLTSLRQGKGIDGDSFMSKMVNELETEITDTNS